MIGLRAFRHGRGRIIKAIVRDCKKCGLRPPRLFFPADERKAEWLNNLRVMKALDSGTAEYRQCRKFLELINEHILGVCELLESGKPWDKLSGALPGGAAEAGYCVMG